MFELKKLDPFRELSTIHKEMDELFKKAFRSMTPTALLRGVSGGAWYPVIDCFMKDKKLYVHADLPGIEAKDLDISIQGNTMTIKGERKDASKVNKGEYLFQETSYGAFERSFTLPEGVDTTKVHATYKDGVLDLSMPIKAVEQPGKVKVKVEEKKEIEKAA